MDLSLSPGCTAESQHVPSFITLTAKQLTFLSLACRTLVEMLCPLEHRPRDPPCRHRYPILQTRKTKRGDEQPLGQGQPLSGVDVRYEVECKARKTCRSRVGFHEECVSLQLRKIRKIPGREGVRLRPNAEDKLRHGRRDAPGRGRGRSTPQGNRDAGRNETGHGTQRALDWGCHVARRERN